MKIKCLVLICTMLLPASLFAQFDGIVGTEGCKAIHCYDARFVEWATGCTVIRGFLNIANQSLGVVSYGSESDAVGQVTESTAKVVSLGDGGTAVVTFQTPIANGDGADFAVFENSFSDNFLELAFVEVSSDGVHYLRFPAVSNTQTAVQIGNYGNIDDVTLINNFAGKYRVGWGTPFDLDELPDDVNLDKNNVQYVKIIDVVGSIDPEFATYDFYGNIVNDPYPTAFASGGFDLAGVGVINNQTTLSVVSPAELAVSIYPNPATSQLIIKNYELRAGESVQILDLACRIIGSLRAMPTPADNGTATINVSGLPSGVYFVKAGNRMAKFVKK